MYPHPQGPLESAEQIVELDNTFLTSDPLGYFMSRAGMIHAWALLTRGGEFRAARNPETNAPRPKPGAQLVDQTFSPPWRQ